jgi:hypothetical protein
MDKLEQELADRLQSIPSGGGELGAYGVRHHADLAAKIIRLMIEQAIRDVTSAQRQGEPR